MKIELQFRKGNRSMESAALDTPCGRVPTFFTDDEWSFLTAVVERLIPQEDGGPGGLEAGVPFLLDRRMATPYGHGAPWYMLAPFLADMPPVLEQQMRYPPRDLYRQGIAIVNEAFRKEAGCHFSEACGKKRDEFLFRLAAGWVPLKGAHGQAFFTQLLTDIKQAYATGTVSL